MDVLVSSALLMVLVPVLVLVLAVTGTSFTAVTGKADAEATARQILATVARDIRSARPIGWCPSAPPALQYTTPAVSCAHVATYTGRPPGAPVPGGPILYADSQQVWFWSHSEDASTAPLAPPDCVAVRVTDAGEVVVDRYVGAGTFTTSTCPGVEFPGDATSPRTTQPPATTLSVGALATGTTRDIFTITDGLIRISPALTYRAGMASRSEATFTVTVDAVPRGAVYDEEQTWDATV